MRGLVATGVVFVVAATAALAEPLVSEDEARLPSSPLIKTRGISRGPSIRIDIPDSVPANSPFELKVSFEPHGQAVISADKVRLIYLKQPNIDLTPRVKPYISDKGINIPTAELPIGSHPLLIEVEDSSGRSSQTTLILKAEK